MIRNTASPSRGIDKRRSVKVQNVPGDVAFFPEVGADLCHKRIARRSLIGPKSLGADRRVACQPAGGGQDPKLSVSVSARGMTTHPRRLCDNVRRKDGGEGGVQCH